MKIRNARPVVPMHPLHQKVDFPRVEHFIVDISDIGLSNVRLDVFEEISQSELSFVYYVTLTLYVTAHDPDKHVLYEYVEPIGTTASTEMKLEDESFIELAQTRIQEVERLLDEANLVVQRGRYSLPSA